MGKACILLTDCLHAPATIVVTHKNTYMRTNAHGCTHKLNERHRPGPKRTDCKSLIHSYSTLTRKFD